MALLIAQFCYKHIYQSFPNLTSKTEIFCYLIHWISPYITLSVQCSAFLKLSKLHFYVQCTIASKINVTPNSVFLPISKLYSILAASNLLAHNNISQICYCVQISLQSAAVNFSFSTNDTFGGNIYSAGDDTHFIYMYNLYIHICKM